MYDKYIGKKIKIENLHEITGKIAKLKIGTIESIDNHETNYKLIITCNVANCKYYYEIENEKRLTELILN